MSPIKIVMPAPCATRRIPRLVFTGYVTDPAELAALYQHCHVYCHGHEFGGTNPALLQALAYGCAVCALDTVFNREMLAGATYGLFFSKENGHLKKLIAGYGKPGGNLERFAAKSSATHQGKLYLGENHRSVPHLFI